MDPDTNKLEGRIVLAEGMHNSGFLVKSKEEERLKMPLIGTKEGLLARLWHWMP